MSAGSAKRLKAANRLVSTVLWVGVTASLPTLAQEKLNNTSAITASTETLIVKVTLNTESKGDIFVQRGADLDFFVKVDDLKSMGFKDPAGSIQLIEGEPHLSLKSFRGVTFSFDERALALNISAEPQLLPSNSFALRAAKRRGVLVESNKSAFLNYAFTGTTGDLASSTNAGFAAETGIRLGDYLLVSDASTVDTGTTKRFVRLTSSVTRDDKENLRRIVMGDLLTPSRDFSNSVNLGGISISKVYGLDPNFVRVPTQTLTGNVTLPSDLEVYIDGQRVRTERLRPGEFELRDILAYGGARNVQVILRDAFGRVQQLNYSFYFSDQPLQEGLHEYSYNFGAMRRQFGVQSNNYGPPAFTMFHRYGVSRGLTLGWHADATRHFLNTGPTVTAVLGGWGVVNLGVTASSFTGRQGTAGQASYNFDSKNWALAAFLRHDSSNYSSLGDPPMMTSRRNEGSVSASYRLPDNASVSLSHTALTSRPISNTTATPAQPFTLVGPSIRRVSALGYSTPLGSPRTQFTATVSRINEAFASPRTEVFVSLNIQLDKNYSAAASYRVDGQSHSEALRFTKNQPVGEGFGYNLSVDRSSANTGNTDLRSDIQYNAPALVARTELGIQHSQGKTTNQQRFSLAGGIVAVGGHIGFSRPVTQSYAIVKVGEFADVEVSVDDQPVGKTNSRGIAVAPNVNAYYENRISIAADALPMDYSLPAGSKRVAPSLRSGVFVDFEVTKTQAFSGRLVAQANGGQKAVEFSEIKLMVDGRLLNLPTGRGGEFYVENLKTGTLTGSVMVDGKPCVFDLAIPSSNETIVDLGELVCQLRP